MKKIKITEKQAKLLETLNSKKVLKVTKEQYNRIIESELNRPSLTETPELHEEEINEDLFREFVNELYGLNEEGAECKYDKLNRVMEAAGLIEGGKLVKEKFGKDARKVKEVVGKGLMKYEECGSVYEAVQYMEEAINRVEPEVGSPAYNSRRDTIDQFGYDPDKGKYGDDIKNLVNDIETIYKNNEEESHSIIKNFLKIRSASKVSNLRQHDLKDLLKILEDKFVNPNQGSMELDENYNTEFRSAKCLAVNNMQNKALLEKNGEYYVFLFDEVKDDIEATEEITDRTAYKEYSGRDEDGNPTYDTDYDTESTSEVTTDNIQKYLNNPDSSIYTDSELNELSLIIPLDKQMMEKILLEKNKYTSKFSNPFVWYVEQIYNKMGKGLDETSLGGDSASGGVGNISYDTRFGSEKPAFKSNVESELTSKIYEALKKK